MSPIEFIVSQLGNGLPPGSRLRSFAVELPDGSILTSTLTPAAASPSQPQPVVDSAVANASSFPDTDGDVATDPDALARKCRNRRERVARYREKNGGDAFLKPREWAPITRLSEREIRRAMRAGALRSTEKGDGRDHGALVVTVDAMEAYLAIVDSVERGQEEPPAWWASVRG